MTPVCFYVESILVFVKWPSGQICKNIMSDKSTMNSFVRQCGILLGQWVCYLSVFISFLVPNVNTIETELELM